MLEHHHQLHVCGHGIGENLPEDASGLWRHTLSILEEFDLHIAYNVFHDYSQVGWLGNFDFNVESMEFCHIDSCDFV